MYISYNEFHISKKIRNLCNFNKGLFASSGNVVFANLKNVRDFQLLINNVFEMRGEENKKLSAGQLNAMGLIDEILHYVCTLYRRDKAPSFFTDLLAQLNKEYTKEQIDSLLLEFMQEFPPVEVYNEKCTAKEYLERDEEIEDIISFIKSKYNYKVLYGGSTNDKNIASLNTISNVDGFLVGGASLDYDKFKKMIEIVFWQFFSIFFDKIRQN